MAIRFPIARKFWVGHNEPLFFIMGPCVIESESVLFKTAEYIAGLREKLGINVIFKSSYDKANRTSLRSFRGPGLRAGLEMLAKVREEFDLPILSDVHKEEEIELAEEVLDVLQIPAFLCRQTDLLVRAGQSEKPINVKKGQFMAPEDMKYAVEKVSSTGNFQVMLTERGTTFGYHNLVVDMRSIPIMKNTGVPVVFDATHSVQLPGGAGGASSGQREFVEALARAAVAAGADGVFMEVHPDPDSALCDGPNSVPLQKLEDIIKVLLDIAACVRGK
ncbi:2-dehydro-3-deoxyphosphooctonate aldolase [Thermosulfidibacter takaii ABI70S6]|uniref:2-dehydro-3-deoxyphosphooctonate aldolase n=1 Tax=Thermosulfidibacter takaii (strain DSM 17441 / JCM 13301 / NBRC 103674 / ABI70S6) TaxID=1298851 RepID=A0A0S3QUJ4_THET7|nr:3-deoxy-8-phosphooctulonate synthase [Thermosulfidibacter takaii]BAT72008.1 2-dehydro-3-deoxyphosphooctonate aldolase [Thermosulfidibacter takaii ABI70S6]